MKSVGFPVAPPGWHYDEDTGALMRDVIHRMGRRCRNWDYRGKGVYQITITLDDRRSQALGRLGHEEKRGAFVELSELGRLVEGVLSELPNQWLGVEVLGVQIMPDHLHVVLAVRGRQRKPLGAIVGSFKSKATSRWLDLLGRTRPSAIGESCASARVPKLWAEGYVDTILFDESAVANALAYLADNPRRLWEKRAHPELFTVLRDLSVDLGQGRIGHFAAIGNHYLLKAHSILQVQCSRRFFAYARDAKGVIQKGLPPRIESDEFRAAAEALLEEAAHGAVLISPCVSEGEREIARQAFVAGHKVITLANKGFSPLYKPGGRLFDHCAAGNLLMLAPVGWPYLPGEKKMTRLDACVLNRLAQLVSGPGAVDVVYKGIAPEHVDDFARRAVAG
ncbi:MAG: hypothetical protein Q4G65_15975 [bacterium]|nr:hypothetical protein [bacterium]